MQSYRTMNLIFAIALAFVSASFVAPSIGWARQGDCGQPLSDGSGPTVADCVYGLEAAVRSTQCATCVCDTDGSGVLSAADGLECLREATQSNGELSCPVCGVESGTTSTPAPAVMPTTTMSMLNGGATCTVGFVMREAVTVGALQFAVDYSAANGSFNGTADLVECTKKVGDLVAFNDIDASSTLNAAFVSLSGFSGPDVLLAECRFTSNGGPLQPEQFVITVEDATDPNVVPIIPFPTVDVDLTDCGVPVCGNGILDPGEECDGFEGPCPGRCGPNCECLWCINDTECISDIPCVLGLCDLASGQCVYVPEPAGAACDDLNNCTTDDMCDGFGSCLAGYPVTCDDGNECTYDTCVPGPGCFFDPFPLDGTGCDDGSLCTVDDMCFFGDCSGGPRDCDDGDVCTDDTCDAAAGCVNTLDPTNDPTCESPATAGRMTGGGRFSFGDSKTDRLTHGFRLNCDPAQLPNRLRIVWRKDGERYRFRLGHMQGALCSDNPAIGPEPPAAGFDTHQGAGTGTLQIGRERQSGATVSWRFTDAGEPNTQDVSELIVSDNTGRQVLFTAARLFVGNHQAHDR